MGAGWRSGRSIGIAGLAGWLGLVLLLALPSASAQLEGAMTRYEAGLRSGSGDGFDSLELYYRQAAPGLDEVVLARLGLDAWRARWAFALGGWSGDHDDTAVIALGPAFERRLGDAPLRLSLGIQPTLISRHDGNGRDLGGPVQFTSHAAIAWAPPGALVIGLRLQHTSNAGIYTHNPGVDIAAVAIGYGF